MPHDNSKQPKQLSQQQPKKQPKQSSKQLPKQPPEQKSQPKHADEKQYALSVTQGSHIKQNQQKHNNTSWYRRAFGKALNFAVSPKLIGDVPVDINNAYNQSEANPLVFYVLLERSRSNSQLIDNETRKLGLPPALAAVTTKHFHEKSAVIYLRHGQSVATYPKRGQKHAHSPRLFRIMQALEKSSAEVLLVPVSIHWGREPNKEDSVLKLLMAESWATTTITKQMINIGVHGRDTYLQFHPSTSLRQLVQEAKAASAEVSAIHSIEAKLAAYLHQQREIMIGPDLSDRRTEVDKILYSPAIKYAITQEAERTNQITKDVRMQARGYMQEIVSDYSASFVSTCERMLNWLWTQLYDGVQVHHFEGTANATDEDDNSLRGLAEKYELVFLPCHRSHIDYLLIMYVLYIRGLRTPYVAAGDNLNIPLVGPLLRRGGAFFLRRSFRGNVLYTAVFREYIHNILSRNIPLKFFLEGGRSRSGRLLQPKTGMLAMTVHSQLRHKNEDGKESSMSKNAGKPIAYIPTYIGYERLAEGGSYVGEMQGKPKESESVFQLLRAMRKIERIYGVVHVNFGEPILLDDILAKHKVDASQYDASRNDQPLDEKAQAAVQNLAVKAMKNINKAAVINPVSLLSLVLLSTPKHALTEESCIAQLDLYREIAQKAQYDERTVLTNMSGKAIIDYGLKLKLITRVNHVMGDMISIADDQRMLLSYFRNNILHLFIMPSMVAALAHHNGRMLRDDILSIINLLYPFLQAELFLKWKQNNIEETVESIIETMVSVGLLMDDGRGMVYAETPDSLTNHQLSVLATPVQQSLKRYFMTLVLMSQQGSGNMTAEQIIDLCYLLGQRMSVLYEFEAPEFFERALFKSFIDALVRTQYIHADDEKKLVFDEKIDHMAENARFILDAETLNTLKQLANLTDAEIAAAVAELEKKKQRRFSRKGR